VANLLAQGAGLRRDPDTLPAREQSEEFYNDLFATKKEYAKPYHESMYYFLWTVIVDRVRLGGHKRILEIGCGPGQLASYLVDKGIEHYTGLDFSATAIEMARKNVSKGNFVVGDARDPALHAQIDHDLVICTEVLEHIEADLVVVSNFQSGKRCLCSVPNFPYESHVRHFRDEADVVARYGPYFLSLDLASFRSPVNADDCFFLMDGIRNERTFETRT
jgi:SAM-dependent methyltransferase